MSVALGVIAVTLGACQADGRDGRGLQKPDAGRAAAASNAAPNTPSNAEEKTMQPQMMRDPREFMDPSAEDYPAPKLPLAEVVLQDATGAKHTVEVEVAANDRARTRGLMWRRELPGGKGMLFIFPDGDQVRSFWMRNTLIPLDMLFIDSAGVIVGIVESAQPRTLTSRTVGKPSTYVLEVPGGWTREKGIRTGSSVVFHGIGPMRVE